MAINQINTVSHFLLMHLPYNQQQVILKWTDTIVKPNVQWKSFYF